VSVAEISPISLGFIRFGAAAILFLITLLIRKGNLRFEKSEYPKLILLAFLCIPVNQFFFLTGIQHSYASHSGVIYSLNPVFAYLIAISRKYEKFYFSKLIAIILTIVGVFFVFYDGLTSTGANPEVVGGDTLLLFAVLSFSLYLALGKELIEKYGALKVSTYVFLAGSVLYIPLFIYDCHNLNFSYLTIIMAYLAYFAWYYALKTIAISKITTMSNLSPLLTVFFSVIFLGEKPSTFLVIGGIIAIIGVIIMHKVSLELN
jgi:drug/metabolite transporter (DMT)-like permease